ncbi:MAG: ABC transporter substrate-binding protein [Alphaproteobacteria bacterium]|nr:ABC transporter substrate-binding protein [Alphaproteobacteria bacterium]
MKKFLLSLCMVLALAACKDENKSTEQADAKPVVKIGITLPLTGDMGSIGQVMKGAVSLAQNDLNTKNLRYNYQFIVEDNAFESKKTAVINQKFISLDKVDAIIDFASKIGLVTTPIAEQNKIIHISACASDSKVAEGKYNFIHWTQPKGEVERLVEKIVADKISNVVIFTQVDQATIEISETMKQKLTEQNVKFKEFRTNPGEKDFNFLLNMAAEEKPELYIILEYSPALDIILKRLNETSNNIPVTSIETFSFLDDKSPVEGQWFVDAAEVDKNNYERFTSYNQSDNLFAVGNIYDAIMLLVQSFEKAPNKENAVEELANIKNYKGVVGDLHQDENGIFNSRAILKRIIDGKPVTVEE